MRVSLARMMTAAALLPGVAMAATFGTVVPMHGTVSDIALDESRNRLYVANFSAYRVEVVNTVSKTLLAPITVAAPPSAVAVSPDGHYLVIGEYQKPVNTPQGGWSGTGGLTIVDLTSSAIRHQDLANPVLVVAFGADGNALVIMSGQAALLDPLSGNMQPVGPDSVPVSGQVLPVSLDTFPGQIIQASAGVSGDRKTIIVLSASAPDTSATSTSSTLLRYDVASQQLISSGSISSPPLGPRVVSVDQDASNFLDGWVLEHAVFPQTYHHWAQFSQPAGKFNIGTHAWDLRRNLIYTQVPAPADGAVLHVMDTDNLTVRERIQLPEDLAGKSVMSSDMNTMYSASVSGVVILPIGQLPQTPQVGSLQEDVLFTAATADPCNASALGQSLVQTIDIVSQGVLGAAASDFTLSLPPGTKGVALSATSGTTPAQIQITVDPSVFRNAKGTTAIPLTITSSAGVNLPPALRLLINSRDFSQQGQILNVPGKIVDMLGDPVRGRIYLLRQDRNLVEVYEMGTLNKIKELRTGNTPVHMAMTTDLRYMIVGNDNSQIANVLDMTLLQPSNPILFPGGHYPRAIGVLNGNMFSIVRNAGAKNPCSGETPTAFVDRIDFSGRQADTPCTLDGAPNAAIFKNVLPTPDGVMAASPDNNYLLMALASGDVVEYDGLAQTWVASRNDITVVGGAYGVLNDGLFVVGPNALDAALVPLGSPFPAADGASSGVALFQGGALRTTATAANAPGVLQRIDLTSLNESNATLMAEAPVTQASLQYPPVGQIGETILSFTRSLAVSSDQTTIFALSISGLTILPGNLDQTGPKPAISIIVSTADNASPASTGGLVSIWGINLSGTSQSSGFPLAKSLGNSCITANGEALPLYFVSPSLVNAQIPYDIGGNASFVVRSTAGVSDPFTVPVQPFAPAVFLNTQAIPGASIPFITREANGLLVTASNPVHRGDTLKIYLAGMGQTAPPATAGVATPSAPAEIVVVSPSVTIGGINAQVIDASLTPGVAGVYQVEVAVSNQTPLGLSLPLTVTQGGSSQTSQVRVVQ